MVVVTPRPADCAADGVSEYQLSAPPLKVVGAIAGLCELVEHDVKELMPVVLVDARRERSELLVHPAGKAAGHRVEELPDLADGEILRR